MYIPSRIGFLLLIGLCAAGLAAYEQPRPRYLVSDLTWVDAQGRERTDRGQLWFADLPYVNEHGRVRGFGKMGYMDGIKWFVPKQAGDIWLESAGSDDPRRFILHGYHGDRELTLAFDHINVSRTDDSKLDRRLEERAAEATTGTEMSGEVDADLAGLTIDGESVGDLLDEDYGANTLEEESFAKAKRKLGEEEMAKRNTPLRFATVGDIGVQSIPLARIRSIVFHHASDGLKRERYTGRFLQYSNMAAGDEGRVRVVGATYFGGPADERFEDAGFFNDETIICGGGFYDLDFLPSGTPIRVIGPDPAAEAYPSKEVEYGRKRKRTKTVFPRRTAVLAHYSADLSELLKVIRLPWGCGGAHKFAFGPDNAIYIAGAAGPHYPTFAGSVANQKTLAHPEAIAQSKIPDKRGRTHPPGPDGYVVKIAPDHKRVAWAVLTKHSLPDIYLRPDGKLLVQRDDDLFYIEPDGTVVDGPRLEITGGNMEVDPETGDIYYGGAYRSATGLEPWVCPYLYKVNASGEQEWTAYSWSGPVVGVQQFRLVSDSQVTEISVGDEGRLTFIGWSDGGNTPFIKQPYDMRISVPSAGFCSSTWGATGGLTVRIANVVQMDGNEMEALSRTQYVAYLPTSDVPTVLNLYNIETMPNGDVAVTGGSNLGFVETHDAWIPSWYIEHRTFEHAQAKGGSFFTLFRPGFGPPRMATRTPGVSGGQLAKQGNKLLLYSGATGNNWTDEEAAAARAETWRYKGRFDTIIENAVQPRNGGNKDGYVMLIDTQGEADPPEIPDWTWDSPARRKAEKKNRRR
ncbi:MAG: hypothetical protein ACOCYP_03200 [Planctomycetota bacterium]